jgi:alpha 1,2-mannosyltransferase
VLYFISSSSISSTQFQKTTEALTDKASKWRYPSTSETPTSSLAFPSSISQPLSSNGTSPAGTFPFPDETAPGERMNATFVTLARNGDTWEIARSIRQVEDRFNRKYHYDWVFLNDQPFNDEFKKVTSALTSGKTFYGLIPKEHWSFPDFIDQNKARKVREEMAKKKIIYGDSVSYRHMCRFESGFFFRQELMLNYEWYWRVEPSVELFCDVNYDPFKIMRDLKKKYSFVLSLYEYGETIPTLWDSVKGFMKKHPEHVVAGNSLGFLSDDGGETYNHCHFVSVLLC